MNKWKQFLRSDACIYTIMGSTLYAYIIGTPCLIYVCWFHGSPWWLINLLLPVVITLFLVVYAKPSIKSKKPERFRTELKNAMEVMTDVQTWMEEERFTEIHMEQEENVSILWGQRYRMRHGSLVEYIAVLSYQDSYSEEKEMKILDDIFQKAVQNTHRESRESWVNTQIISINCIKNRQSTLTKMLYRPAVGFTNLMVHCGYVEQEKSFRIQVIDTMPLNNTSVLRKMRKRVLSIFAGKLTPVQETQKEPK